MEFTWKSGDESHVRPVTHVSKSIASIPAAVLPSSIKAPAISRMPSGGGFEDDAVASFSDEDSSED